MVFLSQIKSHCDGSMSPGLTTGWNELVELRMPKITLGQNVQKAEFAELCKNIKTDSSELGTFP